MKHRLLLAVLLPAALACGGLLDTDQLVAEGEAAIAEGEAFGASTDQDGCIAEGLRRQSTCGSMEVMCQAMNSIWTQGCLGRAAPVAGFCDGVPTEDDIMETARWRVGRCVEAGYSEEQGCQHVFSAIQDYCHGP